MRKAAYFIGASLSLLVIIASLHTWIDPDIWGHLYRGQLMLSAGTVYAQPDFVSGLTRAANHYWFFEVVIAKIYALCGYYGVSGLFLIAWGAVIFGLAAMVRPDRRGLGAWVWLLAAILICEVRFMERPEVFGFLILLFALYRLVHWKPTTRRGARSFFLYFLPVAVLQIVYANVQGYFFLVPALVGLRVACLFVEDRKHARLPAIYFGLLLLGLVGLSAVSPFGFETWGRVLAQWKELNSLKNDIAEVHPLTWDVAVTWPYSLFVFFWIATAALIFYFFVREPKRHVFPIAAAAIGLFVSLTALRLGVILIFFAAPLWAQYFEHPPKAWLKRWKAFPETRRATANYAFVAVVLVLTFSFYRGDYYRFRQVMKEFGSGPAVSSPQGLERYLAGKSLSGRIFNDINAGSYLKFRQPGLALFTDSVMSGAQQIARYSDALFDYEAFVAFNREWNFDHVVIDLDVSSELLAGLLRTGEWSLVYADLRSALLTRETRSIASPVTLPRLYSGEDLGEYHYGRGAYFWMEALGKASRRDWIVDFLHQLADARRVPAPVLESALVHVYRNSDAELRAAAQKVRPRVFSISDSDLAAIDERLTAP